MGSQHIIVFILCNVLFRPMAIGPAKTVLLIINIKKIVINNIINISSVAIAFKEYLLFLYTNKQLGNCSKIC